MGEQVVINFDEVDKEISGIVSEKKKTTSVKDDLLNHKATLNKVPPKSFLKKNSFYGNMYIPIEIIERMLSALFLSYSFKMNIPPIVEEGNIIFFIDVEVKNPVTKEVETYAGTSAVPIKPAHGQLRDIHPHIPAAKSFAIMNACKHIGRLFRAENDDITKVFDSYFENKKEEVSEEDKARQNLKNRLIKMINNKKSIPSLLKMEDDVKKLEDDEVWVLYNEVHSKLSKL
jgi:hypothetical protein